MPGSSFAEVLRLIRSALAGNGLGGLSDRHLLEQFLTERDERAFAVLVERHGPMVLSVCRRIMGEAHHFEDAFQAVFLVLIRKTTSLTGKQSVGGWLHGVARRIALRARAQSTLRRQKERETAAMSSTGPLDELTMQEFRSVLDEEIASLSEKYQGPIVLCHLEGKTYDEAARELGCTKKTLSRRLAKARALLRTKLERRGITLTLAALTTTLTEAAQATPLPAFLALNTVKAATLVATGKTAAGGCLSASALAWAEEALTGMLLAKGKLVALVLGVGLVLGGAGWAGYKVVAETSPGPGMNAQVVGPTNSQATKEKILRTDELGDTLPEGAVVRLGTHPFRHEGSVGGRTGTGLLFTPDGKTLVGSTEAGVILWNAETGQERKRLPMRMATQEQGMALSPDGISLAIADQHPDDLTPKIVFWNLQKGTISKTLSLPEGDSRFAQEVFFLCFSPDGKSLACNNEGKAVVFDLASGKIMATLGNKDSPLHFPLVFSPDAKKLAATVEFNSSVQIWDVAAGRMIRSIQETRGQNERQSIRALAYAPDGSTLALADSKSILLIDPATGKQLGRFEGKLGMYSFNLAFTNDNKKLLSGPDFSGKIQVWHVATGKILKDLKSRSGNGYRSMALSPDGKTVALDTGGFLVPPGGKAVQLWDVATGRELFNEYQGYDGAISNLAYSPDGRTLFSGGENGQVIFWDMSTNKQLGTLPGKTMSIAISPDGKRLATTALSYPNDKVQIWDVTTGKADLVIPVSKLGYFAKVAFSADGRSLYMINQDNTRTELRIQQWDVTTGKQIQLRTYSQPIFSPSPAQGGKTLFAELYSLEDKIEVGGDLTIIDVQSGRQRLLRASEKEVMQSPTPSPDGRMVATGMSAPNSIVRLWEVITGKQTISLQGLKGGVGKIAWSPDGRFVAAADVRRQIYDNIRTMLHWKTSWDVEQSVRLWDAATGKELAAFGGIKTNVTALTFSPDGKNVVAGLSDGTMLVYEVERVDPKRSMSPKLDAERLKTLWISLIDGDASKAHEAVGALILAPNHSVPFLQGCLKSAVAADAAKIQKLITELDSDNFAARQTAAQELVKIGDQVQPAVQKALQVNPPLETRRRLEQLLKTLPDVPGLETVRTVRAIIVLERIGTPEARGVLETLARGAPGARETEEAKGSLERLERR